MERTSRRQFIKKALCSGAGLAVAGPLGAATAAGAAAGSGASESDPTGAPAASGSGASGSGEAGPGRVPRKKLGSTGETVPILLQGGAIRFDPKYDSILHRAFAEGVDYIDTALVYANGQSHAGVATFIEQVGRDKLWITSKGPSERATVSSYTRNLEDCLDQLRTDHLDLFFMHEVDDPVYLDPDYVQMGELMRKSGKTRFFGFSCHGARMVEVMEKAAKVGGIDVIMFRYNFARYGDVELNRAVDACKKAGIGLIAMKTQNSVPGEQKEVKEFQSKDFTLGQAKLKAVWADERIDAAVSHMDSTSKLAENVAAAKSPVQLSASEFRQLQLISSATASLACQGCSHICEPLVEGEVKVAKTLRYLMYKECYGEPERALSLYRRLSPAERASVGVDFSKASAACPQKIDITSRMAVARRELEGIA